MNQKSGTRANQRNGMEENNGTVCWYIQRIDPMTKMAIIYLIHEQ
jgi:hypothetical protein